MENEPKITVIQMLNELNFPVAGWDDRGAELQAKFGALAQPVADALISAEMDSAPGAAYAVIQNLARALNDSIAGFHLAQHGFLNQANNVIRTALEARDLAQLFGLHPEQAEKWHASEKAHVEFKPSAVRELLGKAKYDEIHGWLSETGSHSRSIGSRLMGSGVMVAVDANGDEIEGVLPQAEIVIGPYMDRASIAFSCAWAGYALAETAISLSAMTAAQLPYSERDWIATLRKIDQALPEFIELLRIELTEAGIKDASDLDKFLNPMADLLTEYEAKLDADGVA